MTEVNKEELRRLAEAATPGRHHDRLDAAGGGIKYTCTGDDGSLVLQVDHKNEESGFIGPNGEADEAFFLAATPAAVISLLDENKRIASRLCACRDCGGQGETYSGNDAYQGHFQPPEPVMDVCGTCGGDGVLGPLEDFEALAAERDQLRAEVEALRKDAERFRWLSQRVGVSHAYGDFMPWMPTGESLLSDQERIETEQSIDAAMSKEVSANG